MSQLTRSRFAGSSPRRLRAAPANSNPYLALSTAAARNPRGAAMIAGFVLSVGVTILLIAVSSAQAFLTISHQSGNNTQNRFSLVINGGPEGDESEVSGAGGGAAGGSGPMPTGTVGPSQVVSVRGIRVHRSIADNIAALLDRAEADGVTLSGWGWRDNRTQIRLRRQHCGTSEYAVYRMPSSQCRPPTARPGRSQHERGLAIDFTYNGGSISSRRNPGFRWLDANAASFGLKNLASEPWHWSTTGR